MFRAQAWLEVYKLTLSLFAGSFILKQPKNRCNQDTAAPITKVLFLHQLRWLIKRQLSAFHCGCVSVFWEIWYRIGKGECIFRIYFFFYINLFFEYLSFNSIHLNTIVSSSFFLFPNQFLQFVRCMWFELFLLLKWVKYLYVERQLAFIYLFIFSNLINDFYII